MPQVDALGTWALTSLFGIIFPLEGFKPLGDFLNEELGSILRFVGRIHTDRYMMLGRRQWRCLWPDFYFCFSIQDGCSRK